MRMLSVFIPESYIESLDILVAEEIFPNRSEAIRSGIRDLIRNEMLLKNAIAKRKEENENKKKTNQEKK
ncbi:MAG: ribbon-helix-helix domain-containing protein [Promethearchaeota archaeon]